MGKRRGLGRLPDDREVKKGAQAAAERNHIRSIARRVGTSNERCRTRRGELLTPAACEQSTVFPTAERFSPSLVRLEGRMRPSLGQHTPRPAERFSRQKELPPAGPDASAYVRRCSNCVFCYRSRTLRTLSREDSARLLSSGRSCGRIITLVPRWSNPRGALHRPPLPLTHPRAPPAAFRPYGASDAVADQPPVSHRRISNRGDGWSRRFR
jgi:hypothetical protein